MVLHGRLEFDDLLLKRSFDTTRRIGARAGARRKKATLEVAGLLEAPPGRKKRWMKNMETMEYHWYIIGISWNIMEYHWKLWKLLLWNHGIYGIIFSST